MIEEPVIFYAGLFFLIPFLAQFRLYRVIRVSRYLHFSFLFLFAATDAVITSLDVRPFGLDLLITLSFVSTMLILQLIALDVRDPDPKPGPYYAVAILIFIITVELKYYIFTGLLPEAFTALRISIGQTMQFLAGYLLLVGFRKIVFIEVSPRAYRIRGLWLVAAAILLVTSVMTILSQITIFILELSGSNPELATALLEIDSYVQLSVLFISVITVVFTLVYPENLLLSINQLNTVGQLYRLFGEGQQESLIYTEGLIMDYLQSLSEELFDAENPN